MPLPLSLGIVATDTSHTKAGVQDSGVAACHQVANNLPQSEAGERAPIILLMAFSPGSVLIVIFGLFVSIRYRPCIHLISSSLGSEFGFPGFPFLLPRWLRLDESYGHSSFLV